MANNTQFYILRSVPIRIVNSRLNRIVFGWIVFVELTFARFYDSVGQFEEGVHVWQGSYHMTVMWTLITDNGEDVLEHKQRKFFRVKQVMILQKI